MPQLRKTIGLLDTVALLEDLPERKLKRGTRHGKPAGVLVGFRSEDDWFEYRLEHDPRFLERIAAARRSLRAGRGVRLENVPK